MKLRMLNCTHCIKMMNCNILTPTLMAITAFLSRSPGLLNRGPGAPASLGHVPHSSIFSPTGLISNCSIGGPRALSTGYWLSLPHLLSNWLNFLWTNLYNSSTSTFYLWASQIALIQPVHGQGYILIFLDRMHLFFTPVISYFDSTAGSKTTYNKINDSALGFTTGRRQGQTACIKKRRKKRTRNHCVDHSV